MTNTEISNSAVFCPMEVFGDTPKCCGAFCGKAHVLDMSELDGNERESVRNSVEGMDELSLLILDIAMNSVAAKATTVHIKVFDTDRVFAFSVYDDGVGMSGDELEKVISLKFTSRKSRKIGIGLPLLYYRATQAGGRLCIDSNNQENSYTRVCACFDKSFDNCLPVGDMVSTLCALVLSIGKSRLIFEHGNVFLDTRQLGDIPSDSTLFMAELREYLKIQYEKNNN